jgi:hypothetical protein
MNTLTIASKVSRALPTVQEQREKQQAAAYDQRSKETARRQREADAQTDKIRARLYAVNGLLSVEKELQNKIRASCVRYAENAADAAEIQIAAVLDEALGNPVDAIGKAKAKTLREQAEGIVAEVKKLVKSLHAAQAQIPALEEEKHTLLRQLGVY